MVIIGIDPAFRSGGFAMCVIDEEGDVTFRVFGSYTKFVLWVLSDDVPALCRVIIENSNLQNLTYDMSGSKAQIAKRSRNVGANQAISQETVEICRHVFGVENVTEISPKDKGRKLNHLETVALAKSEKHGLYLKGTEAEQDKRDAYKLCVLLSHRLKSGVYAH